MVCDIIFEQKGIIWVIWELYKVCRPDDGECLLKHNQKFEQ
jgi:hypothetical protein